MIMISLANSNYKKIKDFFDSSKIEDSTRSIRRMFCDDNGNFSIFDTMKS